MVILLAEDDQKIAEFVEQALEREHYTVEVVRSGDEALKKAGVNDYDLLVLDIMLPGKNGFEVCRELRSLGLKMPILMLTARRMTDDKVQALNEGADDYLVKPFDLNELLARIRALTRRGTELKSQKLIVGNLVLDTATHEVYRGEQAIKLTSKEYRILEYLMRHPGLVCSRIMINEHVWGFNYVKSNIIDVYMSRLRSKINSGLSDPMIVTVHGTGYKIKNPNAFQKINAKEKVQPKV